jgi:hypothetical protein
MRTETSSNGIEDDEEKGTDPAPEMMVEAMATPRPKDA